MKRPLGYLIIVLGVVAGIASGAVETAGVLVGVSLGAVSLEPVVLTTLRSVAVVLVFYGIYLALSGVLSQFSHDKRRLHSLRNLLRLVLSVAATVAVLGVVTQQWVGVLVSLGVVGFAVTFAVQQPLLSLLGWVYIMLKQPYTVGDRVKIGEATGDVIDIDFLVTTLWEVNGDLVSSNQPSGRVVTVPNSVVLTAQVYNHSADPFPFVWNEVTFQVSYETNLAFAQDVVRAAADDVLGDEMEARIRTYRRLLADTPVELEVHDRPSVNLVQTESWVELRLRYLVEPRRGQRVKNELVRRVLAAFGDHPDRVSYPLGRNR